MIRQAEPVAWALLAGLAAWFAVHMLASIAPPLLAGHWAFNDFFAHWSYARFAQAHPPGEIYDRDALHAFQVALAGGPVAQLPFAYPPLFLLVLWPFGWLGYPQAYALWIGLTLAAWLWASLAGQATGRAAALLILAPATALMACYGQTGFLTAALLVGGMRLLPARPLLAGVLLGLLAIKPQLAVLVPVALAACGAWRAIAAAALTVAAGVLLSGALLGWAMWPDWLAQLPVQAAFAEASINHLRKPTIMANLLLAGVAPAIAHAVQAALALAMLPLVWIAYRRGPDPQALAVLIAATFVGAPYAFLYDLTLLTNAALVLLAARPATVWRLADTAIVVLALALPGVLNLTSRFYWLGGVTLLLLLGLTMWRARQPRPGRRCR